MGVKIVGMEKLQAKLKKNCTLDDVKKVVSHNGAQLQQKAQRNSPVDSGNLKRSIGLELSDAGLTATSESAADYSPYVEWGTRFMDAQPYMKPAYEVQKEKFKSDMKRLTR